MNHSPGSARAICATNRLYEDAVCRNRRKCELFVKEVNSVRKYFTSFRAGKLSNLYLRRRDLLSGCASREVSFISPAKDECRLSAACQLLKPVAGDVDDYPTGDAGLSTRPSTQATPVGGFVSFDESFRIPTPSPRRRRAAIAWSDLFNEILHDTLLPN